MSTRMREMAGLLVVVGLLLTAGCVQLTVHSTVNTDGSIEEYQVVINTSRQAYGFLEQSAEREGHDSVRESLLSGVNASRAEQIDYDEEFNGDRVSMTITLANFDPPADSSISVTEEDGQLVYEDTTFVNESYDPGSESEMSQSVSATMSVDYYLTMPGEITDSNADEVDGNTAEWHESGGDAFNDNRIYATSEKPTFMGTPGFGPGVALLALALLAAGAVMKTRGEG